VNHREVENGIRKLDPKMRETGDRIFRVVCPAGHYLGQTKRSRQPGGKDLSPILQGQMATQLHVSQAFFRELVGCTKGLQEYLELQDHAGCGR
jgi:hypothetical protein